MDPKKYLAFYRKKANSFLEDFFEGKRKEAKEIDPLAVKVLNSLEKYISGGKKVRGVLTTLGYEASGGKDKDAILPVSAAVEIVHSALLIHDDFIDKDEVRRGKPTVHEEYSDTNSDHYGASMALMVGDIGIFLSHQLIASSKFDASRKIKAITKLERLLTNTGYGQIMDIAFDFKEDASWDDILKVRVYKTAHYTFVLPLTLGAILAGAKERVFEKIEAYGENVGLAFQIVDDILGVFGDPEVTGKSSESDIREGKKTLIYKKSLELADRKDKKFLKKWYGSGKLDSKKMQKIKEIIKNSGAVEVSKKEASRLVKEGKAEVFGITEDKKYQDLLKNLADYIIDRKK